MTEYVLLFGATASALGLLYFSYKKLSNKAYLYAASSLALSLPLMAFVALMANLIIDDSTIKRLTKEHTIASIEFTNIGEQHFRASFTEPHHAPVEYDIYGDQWQVDARILKWTGLAAKTGLKPMYQFERLSGRYQNVQQEINNKRSVYSLSEASTNTQGHSQKTPASVWAYLLEYQDYIPWLDSQYGSATYMPMQHGAVFTIKLSQHGLLARPRNFIASQSLKTWM